MPRALSPNVSCVCVRARCVTRNQSEKGPDTCQRARQREAHRTVSGICSSSTLFTWKRPRAPDIIIVLCTRALHAILVTLCRTRVRLWGLTLIDFAGTETVQFPIQLQAPLDQHTTINIKKYL